MILLFSKPKIIVGMVKTNQSKILACVLKQNANLVILQEQDATNEKADNHDVCNSSTRGQPATEAIV